jgi:uncharacterized HAD superfamily protein
MSTEPNGPEQSGRAKYEEFLLKEYDNIAQAHFNTVSTISTFFKHYLLVVSLPIPLLAWVLKSGTDSTGKGPASVLDDLGLGVPLGAILIAVIGFCVMCYIANLRFDAILYARTVNGIRKYFAGRSGVPFEEEFRVRVLPRSTHQPRYFEGAYFLWVILALGLINAAYLGAGIFLCCKRGGVGLGYCWAWGGMGAAVFVVANLVAYLVFAWHRETRYLRSHIIGVDIDGVLNRHREHFCKMLVELCGKEVDPQTITRIPVHECKELKDKFGNSVSVTEDDEHAIFNHPKYWRDMPADEGAADMLGRLKNVFRFRILIFTHRPWPHPTTFPKGKEAEYRSLWDSEVYACQSSDAAIEQITTAWLRQHGTPYDRLYVEKGNIHTTDPRLLVRNRFVICERKKVRIFVEDDLLKAKKLAHICEVVFLVDQPYNQCEQVNLSNNVIRVKSWREIYEYVREVL